MVTRAFSYDSQGNPVSYLGHTLTWEKGRQLKKYDSNTYTYNANGIRTGKTVSGVKHSYRLEGTKILSEKWGNNTLTPLYDNRDEVCGIVFNGASYYFLKNLQGDVISILDSGRNRVAEYLYDAWGVCTVVNDETEEGIAEVNPFRYRSYYYDSETGIYYLQSRYYDPVVGRFINADDVQILGTSEIVLGYNLFAYCENNPVIYHDPDGYFVITTTMLICAGIGALVFGTIGGIVGYQLSKKWKVPKGKRWKYVLGGVVIGAVSGALIGGAIGYVIGPSTSSGIVLWSGAGNSNVFQAACSFAEKNGLKVLEKTFRGRILNYMQKAAVKLLGKERAWEFMRPLWQAASEQFAKTGQGVVHVFINSSGINFESTFLTIEYWIVRDLGINIVIHLID